MTARSSPASIRAFRKSTKPGTCCGIGTVMRLPRWVILELITSIAGERANVSPVDAPQVMGFETWRWGTRFAREHEELKKLGWEVCEKNQISGIRNGAVKIKLVVCATNSNTGNLRRPPKNFTERSP